MKRLDPDDWYPFLATPEVIERLEQAGIEPGKCWIGDVVTNDWAGESPVHKLRKAVGIWGRDMARFKRAVPPKMRVSIAAEFGTGERFPDLAALKAATV